jgi:hypothetical protein
VTRSRRGRPPPRRRTPYRQPRGFLVLCEGTVTEPGYFEHVRVALREALITIKVRSGGTPLQLVEQAVAERDVALAEARRERDPNAKWDHVWCVTDVDEHTDLPTALKLAEREGIALAAPPLHRSARAHRTSGTSPSSTSLTA